ncbi:MAG: DUF2997 domain-containing protein [Planctomycetaceae bacterium]|nr:DUF2997 domain-containing protein [Planctomycetaceae bacterium]
MSRTIEIIVAPNGQTRVETHGFAGSECRSASQFIERALGQQTDERLKAEFHQTNSTRQQIQEGQ